MSELLSIKQLLQRGTLDSSKAAFSELTSDKPDSTYFSAVASSSFTTVKWESSP
jgi:hypothetical protein